jgi:hypothetical protein
MKPASPPLLKLSGPAAGESEAERRRREARDPAFKPPTLMVGTPLIRSRLGPNATEGEHPSRRRLADLFLSGGIWYLYLLARSGRQSSNQRYCHHPITWAPPFHSHQGSSQPAGTTVADGYL